MNLNNGVVEISQFIDIGDRPYQQDCVATDISDDSGAAFAVICDGMGGLAGGELSSKVAAWNLRKAFCEAEITDIREFFKSQVKRLDRLVISFAREKGVGNTGTTLVAAVIEKGELYWVSVGDSSLYLIQRGKAIRQTRAHNYELFLKMKLDRGEVSQEELKRDKQKRDALISYIGKGNVDLVDVNTSPIQLQNGDLVLLCSDGLTKILSDDEIEAITDRFSDDLSSAVWILMREVKRKADEKKRKTDNISIVLMQYRTEC